MIHRISFDTKNNLFFLNFINTKKKFSAPAIPHKNIETNSRFTTKIDISSHMESLNFQSGNDETA